MSSALLFDDSEVDRTTPFEGSSDMLRSRPGIADATIVVPSIEDRGESPEADTSPEPVLITDTRSVGAWKNERVCFRMSSCAITSAMSTSLAPPCPLLLNESAEALPPLTPDKLPPPKLGDTHDDMVREMRGENPPRRTAGASDEIGAAEKVGAAPDEPVTLESG